MTYQQAIDILTSQGKFYINLGLERVQKILDLIGNPQKNLQFIHVAGTNGKGSVCAMLSAVLGVNGTKVGLFTSPHVFEYTERIKINDIEIKKECFAKKVIYIVELSQKNDIHLTEFEILTIIAFQYFAENKVDIVVLETGLGGKLDATNVIEKNVCSIITNIDLDHTERLGNTIEKIAFEKAGIIKQNCPVIISKDNAGFDVIKKTAKEKNSDLIFGLPLRCYAPPRNDKRIDSKKFRLKGKYQEENLALVLTAIEYLNKNDFNITQETIEEGLKKVKHPCRFEYLKEKNILIDGAHNPNGTKVLRESLNYYFPNQKIKFIFGCLNNKEYACMMENLFTARDEIYFYTFGNKNSCSYAELTSVCKFTPKSFDEFKQDLNTLTVICGSFYMIKELLTKMGIK